MSPWLRNLLVIPLVVGLAIAVFTFLLPKLFADAKELSYTVEGPLELLDDRVAGDVSIEVDGVPVLALVTYKARVWNSGDVTIDNIAVRLTFTPPDPAFRVLNIHHRTTPPAEVPWRKSFTEDPHSQRFVYEFLNPGNQDEVTVLANLALTMSLVANPPGVAVREVEAEFQLAREASLPEKFFALILGIASSSGAVVAVAYLWFMKRRGFEFLR